MEISDVLEHIGLTRIETQTLLKLMLLGETTASRLAKEARMHRRVVYDAMERLVEKGLVSFIDKDRQRVYNAVEPKKIMELVDRKARLFLDMKGELERSLPGLEEQWRVKRQSENAVLLAGKEGIKTLYNDELAAGKTVYVINTAVDRTEEMLGNFLTGFTRERMRKGIKINIIASKSDKRSLRKYRFLEARYVRDEFISPASIAIYGDKVGIMLWSKTPLTVLIESGEIARSFMNYFNLMWKTARK